MKVELITLHRITNLGSLLQTYATQKVLQDINLEVETIDFIPEGIRFFRAIFPRKINNYIKHAIKVIPLFVCNLVQYRMVNKFIKENIKVTPNKYYRYEDLISNTPEADIFISGSDQVWNTQNNNKPSDLMAYYLQFAPKGKKRVAYAGSFGKEDFTGEEKNNISKWIEEYDSVSVREDSGMYFLNEITKKSVEHVLDPTFLVLPEEWKQIMKNHREKTPYIFVYNLNRNKMVEDVAIYLSEKYNMRIINFADTFQFIPGATNRLYNTPKDFIYYLANASYVVTDSFHGTAFSINFNKSFFTVSAPKYNSRIESVLRKFNLSNRLIFEIDDVVRELESNIDYNQVNLILDDERKKSLDYIRRAIYGK